MSVNKRKNYTHTSKITLRRKRPPVARSNESKYLVYLHIQINRHTNISALHAILFAFASVGMRQPMAS